MARPAGSGSDTVQPASLRVQMVVTPTDHPSFGKSDTLLHVVAEATSRRQSEELGRQVKKEDPANMKRSMYQLLAKADTQQDEFIGHLEKLTSAIAQNADIEARRQRECEVQGAHQLSEGNARVRFGERLTKAHKSWRLGRHLLMKSPKYLPRKLFLPDAARCRMQWRN